MDLLVALDFALGQSLLHGYEFLARRCARAVCACLVLIVAAASSSQLLLFDELVDLLLTLLLIHHVRIDLCTGYILLGA